MSDVDALAAAQQKVADLEAALEGRDRIGVAKGMLMLRYGLTDEHAFAYLMRRSQDENIKIRDLAVMVIDDLSAHPWPEQLDPDTEASQPGS